MTLSEIKTFFRTVIKVVAGGPAIGTPGQNRAAGVLAALDRLAEWVAQLAEASTGGESLAGSYTATQAGQQVIAVAGAVGFGKVSVNGLALTFGSDYTTQAGQLTILAAAGVQVGKVVQYHYQTGSAGVPAANPYDVSGAKRQQVAYANQVALPEPDAQFENKAFYDEVTLPGTMYLFRCLPTVLADGSTVLKWIRQQIS